MASHTSWKCALFGVLFAAAALVAAAEETSWKSPGFLVDSFIEIALKSGYSTRQNPVRKWNAPVNYFIVNRVGEEKLHRALIGEHFAHLAQITGLTIQPAASQAAANFLVVLTSEDRLEADMPRYLGADSARQYENLLRHSLCMATFATTRKGSIVRAVAMIPVNAARSRGEMVPCVVEELTHAMGLPNDSRIAFPSIFSHKSGYTVLSGLDYLMLKMLYDPRVKTGMNEKTVRPILQLIAGEYERDKRFETAEKIAAEGGLAALNP